LGITFDSNFKNLISGISPEKGSNTNNGDYLQNVLEEMKNANVKPDERLFNLVINDLVKRKRIDHARDVIRTMEVEFKIPPSKITWSILMKGLGSVGHVDEMLAIFQKIPQQQLSEIEFNTIMYMLIKNHRLDLAIDYFDMMNTSGIEPSNITANILMDGFGRARDLDKCFEIFDAFKEKKKMGTISYNILMSCCMMCRRPDLAVEQLDKMQKETKQPINFLGWNIASDGIEKMNKLEQDFDILQKDRTGIGAYGELMKTCVECGRKDLVTKVTEMMKESQVSLKDVAFELKRKDKTGELYEKVKGWLLEGGIELEESKPDPAATIS